MKVRTKPRGGAWGLLFVAAPTLWIATAVTLAAPESTPADMTLVDASMSGNLDAVRDLLHTGVDVDAAHGDGMSSLHWAARQNQVALAGVLLHAGASIDVRTRIGAHTPLHVAAKSGSADVTRLLLDFGADAEHTTDTGATPLHFAAAAGNPESVLALVEHGARVDPREPNWGQTPLMFASAAGRTKSIEILLEHGANSSVAGLVVDVAARSKADQKERRARMKRVAEQWAAERGDVPEDAGKTKEQLADEQQKRQQEREEAERRGGEPVPLNYAGLVGTHGGLTPLLLAVRGGHVDAALALIKGNANVNQTSAADNTSPMLIAMINGHFDLGMKLFELGADPKIASDAGATPLFATLNMHWAPKARHPQPVAHQQQQTTYLEVMKTLLDVGVDPNARLERTLWFTTYNRDLLGVNRAGATPFWRAAHALDITAMELLLEYGADADIPTFKVPERRRGKADGIDHSGLPPVPMGADAVFPIHAASGAGHGQGFAGNSHRHVPDGWLPAVKFLVEKLGVNANARDHKGYNAIHHAAARGDNDLIRYLVSKGVEPTAVARNGRTTVDMANGPVQRIQPFPETIALLESLGAKNNHNCVSC